MIKNYTILDKKNPENPSLSSEISLIKGSNRPLKDVNLSI